MKVALDTDIASCLSKINGFDVIFKLFPNSKFFIPTRVLEVLREAEELGFRFVGTVFSLLGKKFEIASLNEEEMREYEIAFAQCIVYPKRLSASVPSYSDFWLSASYPLTQEPDLKIESLRLCTVSPIT
jgi:hypothetical protein